MIAMAPTKSGKGSNGSKSNGSKSNDGPNSSSTNGSTSRTIGAASAEIDDSNGTNQKWER
jgi:hypothetical protein